MILNTLILKSINTDNKTGVDSTGKEISLLPLYCYLVKNNDDAKTHERYVTDKDLNISRQNKGAQYEKDIKALQEEDIVLLNAIRNVTFSLKGVLKISDPKPAVTEVGKYELIDVGTYTNLVPIVPMGESNAQDTPITTKDNVYNAVYWDGSTFYQIETVLSNYSDLKEWNNDNNVSFPTTRVFENFIYTVKNGEAVTASDVPGIVS